MKRLELAGMLIKPDTHERGVYGSLRSDVFCSGFELLLEKDIVLAPDDVIFLYPKECKLPKARTALTEYLTNKRTTLWALELKNRPGVDATQYLQEIKGDTQKTRGLRAKYNVMTVTPDDVLNKTSTYFRFLMINNFHVFDNFDVFLDLLKRKTGSDKIIVL